MIKNEQDIKYLLNLYLFSVDKNNKKRNNVRIIKSKKEII